MKQAINCPRCGQGLYVIVSKFAVYRVDEDGHLDERESYGDGKPEVVCYACDLEVTEGFDEEGYYRIEVDFEKMILKKR